MEIGPLKDWFGLFALVISVGTSIWHMISSGSKKTASDLSEFRKQDAVEKTQFLATLSALERRVQSVESDIKHLPDAEAVMSMRIAIERLEGKLGRMETSQEGMARTVARVEDFLMKGSSAA